MQAAKVMTAALFMAAFCANEAAAGSTGRCGGTGGNHTKVLTCPSGQYIVGLGARGGAFVDQFSIVCQKIPVSGTPGERGDWRDAGPGGGTQSRHAFCKSKQAVLGLRVKSGSLMDKIMGFGCDPRSGSGWDSTIGTDTNRSIDIGGPGGIGCDLLCPPTEALYQVTVKYGGVIDSIKGQCRK
jgi:hypothetical protein